MDHILVDRPPWLLRVRSSQTVILVTISGAAFTDGFIYSVFVPILPIALHDRYHVEEPDLQFWSSTLLGVFGAVVLLGSPIIGWVSDKDVSRKSAYTLGLICLTGGVATLAITTELWMLVISRILQGISAAVVFTVGLAMIADTVDPKDVGYNMGYALSSMSFGVLVGPVAGSVFFDAGGYFAVVSLMLTVTFVDIILRLFMIEKSTAAKYEPNTPVHIVTEHTQLLPSPILSAAQELERRGGRWKASSLMLHPRVATAIYGVFVHVVIIAGFDGVLTIFLERVFDWSPLKIGSAFLAIGVPNAAFGPLAGTLSDHYGPRWLAFLGCVVTGILMTLLQFVRENTLQQVLLLYLLLMSLGSTLSLIISPLAADLFHVVETLQANGDAAAYAQSYGLFTCAMAAGTLVGPVLAGFLKETFGWNVMTLAMGALVASGAFPVVCNLFLVFPDSGWLYYLQYFYTGGKESRVQVASTGVGRADV